MKKVLILALAAIMVFSLSACTGGNSGGTNTTPPAGTQNGDSSGSDSATAKIGISMPTQSLQRWNQDGSNMQKAFQDAGYEVDLQYGGDNDIATQVAQIENMISGGCQVLVIAAIDGDSLTAVLQGAKDKNIPVIAYDRLIMNSDAVSYYATFDNTLVGRKQGEYIEEQLNLKSGAGPFNIELITGDAGDNNVNFFWGGAMEVLKPYLDSGKLVVPSGQTDMLQCATEGWNTANAQSRFENIISTQGYSPTGKKLDAVLASNDSTAQGVTTALVAAGFTKDNFPPLTGQDCDIASMKNMLVGLQGMSVFKDTRTLADQVVKMADAIVKGGEPEINDTETYDNGTGVIPSFLCDPVVCTLDNYKTLLIDSGYYTEADLAS